MLARELQISDREIYRLPTPLDLRGLFTVADVDRSDLEFPKFFPRTHPDFAPTESAKAIDLLAAVRHKDVLVQHPYHSFSTSVQAFIEQAASDPKVLAIKQTLYRTSGDSPIVDALIDAAEAGKQVLAVVEIKARFDEVNNISWARKLEEAGVHVVYGVVGLKTHAKLCLVVRQESEGLVRYCHIGTGNYNGKTARVYEDFGLFTTDPQVGEDLSRLFNLLSGYRAAQQVQAAARRAAVGALRPHRPRRARRSRSTQRRDQDGPSRPHRHQGQLDRRRGRHRRALPREHGRRAGRRLGAWHLRAASGRRGALRATSGCARCSGASSSTPASSGSTTAATRRSTSAAPT